MRQTPYSYDRLIGTPWQDWIAEERARYHLLYRWAQRTDRDSTPPPPRPLTAVQQRRAELKAWNDELKRVRQMHDEEVNAHKAHKKLARQAARAPQAAGRKRSTVVQPETAAEIKNLYAMGNMNILALARIYNCTRTTVWQIITNKYDINRKPPEKIHYKPLK